MEQNQVVLSSSEALKKVYEILQRGGYDPVAQIAGYLITEDPTYITNVENARVLVRNIDRDEMIKELILHYVGEKNS